MAKKKVKSRDIPAVKGGKPQRKNFLVFGSPRITNKEIKEMVKTLKSGWIGTGPRVSTFEDNVKTYLGSKYAKAVNSCTAAMHLALIAIGIKPGDEVITSPMTFGATANVIEHVGAVPVFADVELETMNIDPKEIEKKITKKTKAILPVHIAGRPCNMDEIMRIAKKYNVRVIEDAAHAFGAEYRGRKIGTIGDLTAFSFYVTKNLTTGEGGMLTMNNKKFSELVELYALHGMTKGAWKRYTDSKFRHYLIQVPGYKYNMTDMQASLGIHQLGDFEKNQKRREKIWNRYTKAFRDLPIITPADPEIHTKHAYHLYPILIKLEGVTKDRNALMHAIYDENIGLGIHFISLHEHPYYKNKYKFKKNDFPNSGFISDRTISLPFSAKLTDRDVDDVIRAVTKVVKYYAKKSSR
jgi:dTDP-4-amino-4,6-dideoxygalactose transaminase